LGAKPVNKRLTFRPRAPDTLFAYISPHPSPGGAGTVLRDSDFFTRRSEGQKHEQVWRKAISALASLRAALERIPNIATQMANRLGAQFRPSALLIFL
jgi:hypothetical protein